MRQPTDQRLRRGFDDEEARASRPGLEMLVQTWDQGRVVLLVDVDGMSAVNQRYGREVGDCLLAEVFERVVEALPDGTALRIGGDEFAIVAPCADEGEALAFAVTLEAAVFQIRFGPAAVGGSVGCAFVPARRSPFGAFAQAHEQLLAAKGGNRHVFGGSQTSSVACSIRITEPSRWTTSHAR